MHRAAVVVVVGISLCSPGCATRSAPARPLEPYELEERDCGRTIRIKSGRQVIVRLHPLAGAGYAWHLRQVSMGTKLSSTTTVPAKRSSLPTDRDQLFTFDVSASGNLLFEHYRPWLPGEPIGRCELRFDYE